MTTRDLVLARARAHPWRVALGAAAAGSMLHGAAITNLQAGLRTSWASAGWWRSSCSIGAGLLALLVLARRVVAPAGSSGPPPSHVPSQPPPRRPMPPTPSAPVLPAPTRRSVVRGIPEGDRLLADLDHGLQHDELRLDFQPLVRAVDRTIVGFEALVRWEHPVMGELAPDRFVPAAEASCLAVPLGDWVLREAGRTASSWAVGAGVAVNVCASQVAAPGFVDRVRSVLDRYDLDPARLTLELVERSSVLDHRAAVTALHDLHDLGVSIALDDFLVAYSSIGLIDLIPVDVVKLDRSFVEPLNGGRDAPIAEAVVAVAARLGIAVVAEGVETAAGERGAIGLGCDQLQGYRFSRPVPAPETHALLATLPWVNAVEP